MNRSSACWRSLRRDRRGAVFVEAALLLPLFAIAVVAFVDVSRYMQLTARADRIASGVADLVSRADQIRDKPAYDPLTSLSTDTGVFFEMARVIAEPEDLAKGGVVIASITGGAAAAKVNWVRSDGAIQDVSTGRLQAIAPLPEGMPFVVAEVFLPFQPVVIGNKALLGTIGFDSVIYRRAVFRPRSASLTALEPGS
jgi:Flp pilus assembly pilin Flp